MTSGVPSWEAYSRSNRGSPGISWTVLAGQPAEVARVSGAFARAYLVGMLPYAILENLKRCLQVTPSASATSAAQRASGDGREALEQTRAGRNETLGNRQIFKRRGGKLRARALRPVFSSCPSNACRFASCVQPSLSATGPRDHLARHGRIDNGCSRQHSFPPRNSQRPGHGRIRRRSSAQRDGYLRACLPQHLDTPGQVSRSPRRIEPAAPSTKPKPPLQGASGAEATRDLHPLPLTPPPRPLASHRFPSLGPGRVPSTGRLLSSSIPRVTPP